MVRGSALRFPEDGGTGIEQQDAVFRDANNSSDARRRHHREHRRYAKKLHRVSHILHYCSIVILGIFAFQVQTNTSCDFPHRLHHVTP